MCFSLRSSVATPTRRRDVVIPPHQDLYQYDLLPGDSLSSPSLRCHFLLALHFRPLCGQPIPPARCAACRCITRDAPGRAHQWAFGFPELAERNAGWKSRQIGIRDRPLGDAASGAPTRRRNAESNRSAASAYGHRLPRRAADCRGVASDARRGWRNRRKPAPSRSAASTRSSASASCASSASKPPTRSSGTVGVIADTRSRPAEGGPKPPRHNTAAPGRRPSAIVFCPVPATLSPRSLRNSSSLWKKRP